MLEILELMKESKTPIILAVTAAIVIAALLYLFNGSPPESPYEHQGPYPDLSQIQHTIVETNITIGYVTNSLTNELLVVDLDVMKIIGLITTGEDYNRGPYGIDITPDGQTLYMTFPSADVVKAMDTTSFEEEATIQVGKWPIDIILSPDGSNAYVACCDSGSVCVIDTATNSVETTIQVSERLGRMALAGEGDLLCVSAQEGLAIIDVATSQVVSTVPIGYSWPGTLTVTEEGFHAYVAYVADVEGSAPKIQVVETESGTIVDTIDEVTFDVFPDSSLSGMALSPDGGLLYAVEQGYALAVIDTATNTVLSKKDTRLPETYGAADEVYFSQDGRKAYLLYWGGIAIEGGAPDNPSALTVIDTSTHERIATIILGDRAGAADMAIRPGT